MSDPQVLAREAFDSDESARDVSKRLSIGRDRLLRLWRDEFGVDAVRERGNRLRGAANRKADPARQHEALEAFTADRPMKEVAKRLGVHYVQVRNWWGEAFGEEAVKQRARRLQVTRTTENNRKRAGSPRNVSRVEVPCDLCGASLTRSAISIAKTARILCATCQGRIRGVDTPCPVCKTLCVGKRGLATHFRHAQDEAHIRWQAIQEEKRLGVEGVDHVVCLECGYRAQSLWRHLETEHGTTPKAYVQKWPGALWRTQASESLRKERSAEVRRGNGWSKGESKTVECPNCTQPVQVSLFAGSIHDLRCDECKAEDFLILWKGRKEPDDYVVCLECGYRAEFLLSHIRAVHGLEQYLETHPHALLTALKAGQREAPARKLVLTVEQLQPFMDQGKVIAAAAAKAFKCAQYQIRRNCRELGLETRSRLAWQKAVLDAASHALQAPYEPEWSDPRIISEDTGRLLYYDGYFPSKGVIVEAHGDQHFYYIEQWHRTHDEFERLQAIDKFKLQRAQELGYIVKVIRYNDPIHDPSFWKALFAGDQTLWVNKSSDEQGEVAEKVLQELRQVGFPDPEPSSKTLAEFTKLCNQRVYLDDERFIRPYSSRGTVVCASFFPNRYRAAYRNSVNVRDAWDDNAKLKSAIRVQLNAGHPTTPDRVLRALQMICRTPSVFRPAVAKYVCQSYCPPGGVVWDPCSGYGGRLFGALAAGVGLYVGSDIEPETVAGNQMLAKHLGKQSFCRIVEAKAEEYDPGLELDLVFTSPPYFNLEIYGDASKKNLQSKVEHWLIEFLHPLMRTAYRRLKVDGALVLNLPEKALDGAVLSDEAIKFAVHLGFSIEEPVYMPVRRLRSKALRREPLLVFRR